MFAELKTAGKILSLAAEVQKIDADGNGKPDLQDHLADCVALTAEVAEAKAAGEKVAARVNKIGERLGKDVALIQEKLGLPEHVAIALVEAQTGVA